MTLLAPVLEKFFTDRLRRQRDVSANTVAAYRDAFRLLLRFAQQRLVSPPAPPTVLFTEVRRSSSLLPGHPRRPRAVPPPRSRA